MATVKAISKTKNSKKRKNSKDKRVSKLIESKKQAAKVPPLSFVSSGGGFHYQSKGSTSDLKLDKPGNNTTGNFHQALKRGGSIEEYKMNAHPSIIKGHKRSSQDSEKMHMTIAGAIPLWDENPSISPTKYKKRSKYSKDLKKITTHLGYGASRNSASKGILSGSNTSKNAGRKVGKVKSPKYQTQNVAYYVKGKNSPILTRLVVNE